MAACRAVLPKPLCLAVKLNSGDYLKEGGLTQDEALEQVRWLMECEMVDMVEISGGIAEQSTSGLHSKFKRSVCVAKRTDGYCLASDSFNQKTMDKAPQKKESTRIREAYFTQFAERIQLLQSAVPIQLSGGFRSRVGMADAIASASTAFCDPPVPRSQLSSAGACSLVGLGRSVVLQPDLPKAVILNPAVADDVSFAMSHQVRGQWMARLVPVKVVGSGLPIQFFYYNIRRIAKGLQSQPSASIPYVVAASFLENVQTTLRRMTNLVCAPIISFKRLLKLW